MGCSHLVLCFPDFWKCTSSHICEESHPTAASKISAIPRIKQKEEKNEEREKEREREGEGEEKQTISSTQQDRTQAVQSLPGFSSYPWKEGESVYMVTWNTSEKSKQILASLENQKHNDTIMLAVYFSQPQAAWQNVTVKSSRHERLTDVYFATRLHTFLLQDFCTCWEVSAAAPSPTAAAPRGNPTTSAMVGARGLLGSSQSMCWAVKMWPVPSNQQTQGGEASRAAGAVCTQGLRSHHALHRGSGHP